jgi:hypothetical protein
MLPLPLLLLFLLLLPSAVMLQQAPAGMSQWTLSLLSQQLPLLQQQVQQVLQMQK